MCSETGHDHVDRTTAQRTTLLGNPMKRQHPCDPACQSGCSIKKRICTQELNLYSDQRAHFVRGN